MKVSINKYGKIVGTVEAGDGYHWSQVGDVIGLDGGTQCIMHGVPFVPENWNHANSNIKTYVGLSIPGEKDHLGWKVSNLSFPVCAIQYGFSIRDLSRFDDKNPYSVDIGTTYKKNVHQRVKYSDGRWGKWELIPSGDVAEFRQKEGWVGAISEKPA